MPDTRETISAVLTPSAPLESNISREHEYTDLAIINISEKEKWGGSIDYLLSGFTSGCGRINLVSIEFKIQAEEEGASFKIGTAEVGSEQSVDLVSLKPNGFRHIANARNYGSEIVGKVVPEDTFSRQVRPQSADLPMLRLLWEIKGGMTGVLIVKYKVLGMRVHNFTFTKAG